ncbi:527_t:CDS:10 [Ambispora gerdemannii]|uniref:V-type proton ATPase subunit C n=1 Tax=Ambispora gerdemannii TaxID=144530 RepID=A0A9N8YM60_9GLOM|nr:527_t:CDS:10 [Ambispora gerdemannii]
MSKTNSNIAYWFISVPAKGDKNMVFRKLKDKISGLANEYSETYQFIIPQFKIGTLDGLVMISDELLKFDQAFEGTTLKLLDILRNLLKGDINLIRANFVVNEKSIDKYLETFQWNIQKYREDKSLQEIANSLNQEVSGIDSLMKKKLADYNQVKGSLQALERKQNGNLSVKNLADFVRKEHFVHDSEHLETLLFAVSRNLYKDWYAKYETLTQMVVPRSSIKITEDDDYGLFTVTLFKRVADDFVNKAREEGFTYREFKYNEADIENQRKQLQEIGETEKELSVTLLRLAKTNFGEVFSAWIHLKALRVYVESVLRYGLPPDFMSSIIKPKHKQEHKVREVLNKEYGKLGGILGRDTQSEENIEEFHNLVDKDYYPYVWFQIHIDLNRR